MKKKLNYINISPKSLLTYFVFLNRRKRILRSRFNLNKFTNLFIVLKSLVLTNLINAQIFLQSSNLNKNIIMGKESNVLLRLNKFSHTELTFDLYKNVVNYSYLILFYKCLENLKSYYILFVLLNQIYNFFTKIKTN